MFVWVFHRITGLLLIALLGLKFLTSFFLMTKDKKPDWALVLHTNDLTDILSSSLWFFMPVRAADCDYRYGVRKEKLFFWVFTGLGLS